MMKFLLIAFLHGQSYVLDSGLSGEDCIGEIESGIAAIQIDDSHTVPAKGAILACQLERPQE